MARNINKKFTKENDLNFKSFNLQKENSCFNKFTWPRWARPNHKSNRL